MGTKMNVQLIDVGMEYSIHESDAGTLVRILVGELDVNLPETALEGCCDASVMSQMSLIFRATHCPRDP